MSSEPTISLTEDPLLFSRNTQILCSEFCLKRNCASKLCSESTNHPWSLRKSNRSVHVLFLLLEYMASPLKLFPVHSFNAHQISFETINEKRSLPISQFYRQAFAVYYDKRD